MHGIKIPLQDFAPKMQGGAYARGGAYLWDTTVHSFSPNYDLPFCVSKVGRGVTVYSNKLCTCH